MARVVNEVALRKHLVDRHGEDLADGLFEVKLAEAQKQAAKLNSLEAERAQVEAEIADQEVRLPSLERERKERDDAREVFLAKSKVLADLEAANAGTGSQLRAKLDSLDERIRSVGKPSMHAGWVKVASAAQPPVVPPLVKGTDQDPARRSQQAAQSNWATNWR